MSTFDLEVTRTITISEGWGVTCMPIWAADDDPPEHITEVEVFVAEITHERCELIGGAWCVLVEDGQLWVPVENFQKLPELTTDDTHDLRTRWFATEAEAREHADWVVKRWEKPAVWESFVVLG
jgi:hypothetical protein